MYSNRQLAYAPTPYIPRSTLSATINLDEVCSFTRPMGYGGSALMARL
jgi:hypothetical protein